MDPAAKLGLRPGMSVAGRYRVEERLEDRPGRLCFRASTLAGRTPILLFEATDEEVELLRSVDGQRLEGFAHVIDILELERGGGLVVTEFVDGVTLARIMEARGRLAERPAVLLTRAIAAVVVRLHRQGCCHGSLMPRTVYVDNQLRPKVTLAPGITEAQPYRTPERNAGAPPSRMDDVWALTAILYESLTGGPPPAAGIASIEELVLAGITEPSLSMLIKNGLNTDADRRLRSADDLVRQLGTIGETLREAATDAEPPPRSVVSGSRTKRPRRPRAPTLIGVAPPPARAARTSSPDVEPSPPAPLPTPATRDRAQPSARPPRRPRAPTLIGVAPPPARAARSEIPSGIAPAPHDPLAPSRPVARSSRPVSRASVPPPSLPPPPPPRQRRPRASSPGVAPPLPPADVTETEIDVAAPFVSNVAEPLDGVEATATQVDRPAIDEQPVSSAAPVPLVARASFEDTLTQSDKWPPGSDTSPVFDPPQPDEFDDDPATVIMPSLSEASVADSLPAFDASVSETLPSLRTPDVTSAPVPSAAQPSARVAYHSAPSQAAPSVPAGVQPSAPMAAPTLRDEPSPSRPSRSRRVGLVAFACTVTVSGAAAAWYFGLGPGKPLLSAAPAASISGAAASAPSSGTASAAASLSAGAGTPSATPASSAATGVAAAAADPAACLVKQFPQGSFAGKPKADWLCSTADPRRGAVKIRSALVKGGQGRTTDAMRFYSQLGWFEIASYVVIRHECCATQEIKLPRPDAKCSPMKEPLAALATAANGDGDVEAAVSKYASNVTCEVGAGRAGSYWQRRTIRGGERSAFSTFLKRRPSK